MMIILQSGRDAVYFDPFSSAGGIPLLFSDADSAGKFGIPCRFRGSRQHRENRMKQLLKMMPRQPRRYLRWLLSRWRRRRRRAQVNIADKTLLPECAPAALRPWSNVRRCRPAAAAVVTGIHFWPTPAAPMPGNQSTRIQNKPGSRLRTASRQYEAIRQPSARQDCFCQLTASSQPPMAQAHQLSDALQMARLTTSGV